MQVRLAFGENDVFDAEVVDDCVRGVHTAALEGPLSDPAGALARALEQPLDFPPLSRAVVPGDQIVLALDSSVPQLPLVVGEIVSVLLAAQVEPGDLTFLTSSDGLGSEDPRAALANPVAERIEVCTHDPSDEQQLGYLTATAGEERVYLNRRLIDADFIVPVARMGFDPLLGHRPTTGALFPDFSNEPDNAFRILLSHTPDHFAWARQQNVHLMLAGHVHGGQIVFPLLDPYIRRRGSRSEEHTSELQSH